jgi:hypothetical protein
VREWTLTLPNELSLCELESPWTPKFLKSNYKGQNPLDWRVLYSIENLLECRCLKWAHMSHLDISNTSYGQKKSQESNLQFDSWPLKVKNCLDFFAFRWCVTYRWKDLDQGYNFSIDLISIASLHTTLWPLKVAGVSILGISRPPLGVPGQSDIWVLAPWPGTQYIIRGKVVASPQVRAVMNLGSLILPVARPNTKSAPIIH